MRRLYWVVFTALCSAAWSNLGYAQQPTNTGMPEPKFARQSMFSIPFRITPARTPAEEPSQVQLLVSNDAGKSWQIDSSVLPSQSAFNFRATRDGEYWFIIRTLDAKGQPKNQAAMMPGMRVIVDTTPPLIDLFSDRGPSGEVRARWQVSDAYLDPSSFKLEYQTAASPNWQPIAVDPRSGQTPGIVAGSTTFVPQGNATGVVVRVKAADRAGNPTEAQISAEQQGPAIPSGGETATPTIPQANPSMTPARTTFPTPPPAAQPGLSDPSRQRNPAPGATTDRVTTSKPFFAPPSGTVAVPPENPAASPLISTNQKWSSANTSRGPLTIENPLAANGVNNGALPPPSMPKAYPNDTRPSNGPFTPAATDRLVTRPQPVPINPPVANRFNPDDAGPQLNATGTTRPSIDIPPGEQPLRVNSTKFELAFDPDPTASTTGKRIELFGSRDGGKNWTSYGLAPLNGNTISVRVDAEGTYGFKLTGQRRGEMASAPKSGELPEAWVIVDLTKPEARLTSADYSDNNGPELKIRWDAADLQLAARPISLFFAADKAGPWSPIATGLDNSGVYGWRLDNRVPDRAFLRLEVRDEAGNLTAVESADPVALNPSLPTGKIRGVRSLSDDGAATRWKTWK